MAAAAALRRMLLPTIRRPLAPRQPLPSFTGTTMGAQQRYRPAADRRMIRSSWTDAGGEDEKKLTLKQALGELAALSLTVLSIYGVGAVASYYWSSSSNVQYEHDFPEDD